MQPRFFVGILIKPYPVIMALLAILFGGALFVTIVGLLMLAWIEQLILAVPILAVPAAGIGVLACIGIVRLLRAGYRRYLA